ncbi:hypothetical protein [Alloalcanivorax gelatiniphagus]|uniref:Low-complexity protein n=1 Tax=Alloalcanivorax gelatiniphagus TaxID=1194167 RepID=A0ABY2XNH5_9GAMM|nr:hypothetical protein [Alloalcanivorax gelatiniphagus]TMW13319.1 hypothetical protein FGS76_07040 [Alloalcanivorax gelatiniphagus]
MSKERKLNPLAATLGAAVVASAMSIPAVQAADNPFGATDLQSGYQLAGDHSKDGEGKCGEGTCGDKGDKKGEGSCGGADKKSEGSCGGKG